VPFTDAVCSGASGIAPRPKDIYVLEFTLQAPGVCRLSCFQQFGQSNGSFEMQPCLVPVPPNPAPQPSSASVSGSSVFSVVKSEIRYSVPRSIRPSRHRASSMAPSNGRVLCALRALMGITPVVADTSSRSSGVRRSILL
jgi:hypothetical protein